MKNHSQAIKLSLFLAIGVALVILFSNAQASLWGCKPATIKVGETTRGCINVNNLKREYNIHAPKRDPSLIHKRPLVIGLHGGGGNPKRFENQTLLNHASEQHISVYPKGFKKHWNDGRSLINPSINDVQFLNQLVSQLIKDPSLKIDETKIFIIGMSNGGLMALRMACEQPQWLSGVGIVAATMSHEIYAQCLIKKPLNPLKIAFVFGDKDTSFLNNGQQVNPIKTKQQRGTHIGIQKSVDFWRDVNDCNPLPDTTLLDADPHDKTQIIQSTYQQCQQSLIYFNVKNGGHRWPNRHAKNGPFWVKRINIGLASQDMHTAKTLLSVLF